MRALIICAAVCGFLLVAVGAIGAHMVVVEAADRWNSAMLYGFVHALAALGAAAAPLQGRIRLAAGWAFIAGVVLFSGIQIARMLAGSSATPLEVLGPLVPVGGIAFMLGWVLLAIAAGVSRRSA